MTMMMQSLPQSPNQPAQEERVVAVPVTGDGTRFRLVTVRTGRRNIRTRSKPQRTEPQSKTARSA
ncbi:MULTISPECIES: hypothetical protein [unclassified Actinomyces]|uniref:hypothetical protein n=1 Tax=unclassified Actinomyces TaxID=2609248 RepID=UPI00137A0F68|nr:MULTISPECIES: hypothetical protein [unclassified Actinomyces]MBW3068293.1 hypothetical protein [Actinomyces sp. 594]NDR53336.1 hypothetical protein [Actinomyces sp. 565]